jgi:hypothetical protein
MKELQDLIIANFNAKVESGKLNELIDKKVDELMTSTLDSALRGYSDFTKAFEKKFQEKMIMNLDSMSFPQFSEIVVKAINNKLSLGALKITSNVVDTKLNNFINDLLTPPPEKIKLSELVERYIEQVRQSNEEDCSCEYSGEVGFVIEPDEGHLSSNYKWHSIYLKEDGTLKKKESFYGSKPSYDYDVKIRIMTDVETSRTRIVDIGLQYGTDASESFFIKQNHGFDKFLFEMYCCGTLLELDEDDVCTEWERDS